MIGMKYRIGVDIGGTTIKTGAVDENYKIVQRHVIDTPDTYQKSLQAIAKEVTDMAEKLQVSMKDILCVGVGAPGSVVPETGQLIFANNTDWVNEPMKKDLQELIEAPVYFGNDANCAIIGEAIAGAAKNKKNVLMLTLGTGVGGGIIIGGKMFSGGNGLGAELGHMPIISGGRLCTCGLHGCLEAYASAPALIAYAKAEMEKDPSSQLHQWKTENGNIDGRAVFECAKAGDIAANKALDIYVSYLADAIGGYTNIFRPEMVLLGGGLSNAGEFLLSKLEEKIPHYTFAYDLIGGAELACAKLGNDAGIIGAAYYDTMS